MCVSSPVYSAIIGNVRGARQMLPDPDSKADNQREARARTSGNNNNDNDNQDGDMPSWVFKEESNRGKTKNRDLKKKPSQMKKNDYRATEEGTSVLLDQCQQGLRRRRESDKIHPLKVKEAMSSVDKTTIEDLQKKDSTLKKCFDRVGKPIFREELCWRVFHEEWTTL